MTYKDSNNKHQAFRRSVKKKRLFSEYYQMLSYKACQSTSNLRGNLARMLFTFGMAFSWSKQMTEASWEQRFEGLTGRYPVTDPFCFTVDHDRALSRLITLAKKNVDLESVATEYLNLVEIIFPEDLILKAFINQASFKGMTIPIITANGISSYPDCGWIHLFPSNPILQSEVKTLMKYTGVISVEEFTAVCVPQKSKG
jgi:spore maturation protein CgeB